VSLDAELLRQTGDVDGSRTEIQLSKRVQQGCSFLEQELGIAHPAGKAVGLQNVHGRLVDQAPAVDARDHVVFPVQPADHRNHGLGESLPAHPLIKTRI
jgi:hypothetical protein